MRLLACESDDSKETARALLLLALEEGYGLTELPSMEREALGKPFFPGLPHIHFNLSHSGPYALCAVGEGPVGVDIEAVRPRRAALPQGVLTGEEYRWYQEQGGGWEDFYTLWTRKESWAKYAGGSVAKPRGVCPPLPGEEALPLHLVSLAGPGWRAAVCSGEPIPALEWRNF